MPIAITFAFYSLKAITAGSCMDDNGQAHLDILNNLGDVLLTRRALGLSSRHYDPRFCKRSAQ